MSEFSTKSQVASDSALRDGLTKNHKASEKLVANGEELTISAVAAVLNKRVKLGQAAVLARENARKATADHRAEIASTKALVANVRTQIKARVGADDPGLLDYGITPGKAPKALTAEETVFKVAKGQATRTARGTRGKRELAKVRGEAPTQIVLGDAHPPEPTPPGGGAIANGAPAVTPSPSATNGALNGAMFNGALNGAALSK